MALFGKKLAEVKIWLKPNMETLQRTANRGSVSTGFNISNSLKLEADDSEWLYKANDAGTNRKTFTVSMWFKRTELANDYMQLWQGGSNGEATRLGFYGGTPKEAIWVDVGGGSGNTGSDYRSYSVQVLRDTSAWYHIVLAVDTTQGTAANRLKVWLNGDEITTWTNQAIPAQDFQCSLEASINMHWGAYNSTYYKMCGYIAECHYLDGVAKVQTDFGEVNEDSGIWKPIKYDGTYGGNGCYLKFDDSSDLGKDSSGNGNTFTLNNVSAANQAQDSPTNNFCILNAVYQAQATKYHVVSNGGTFVTGTASGTAWDGVAGTIPLFKGKWYFELKKDGGSGTNMIVGAGGIDQHLYNWRTLTAITTGAKLYFSYNGTIYSNGQGGGASWTDNDIISIAIDQDNLGLYFAKNGAWQNSGDPESGSDRTGANTITWGDSIPAFNVANNVGGLELNFGGFDGFAVSSGNADANGYGNFEYAPPTGYYAICTKNLAEFG